MTNVVVLGDSLPALAAALEIAEVGLGVHVMLQTHAAPNREHDQSQQQQQQQQRNKRDVSERQMAFDTVPHAVGALDPAGVLREFLTHVSSPLAPGTELTGQDSTSTVQPVRTASTATRLRDSKGRWVTQPMPAILGIPAVPLSEETLAVLGGGHATRAFLDRIKPVLTIGKTHSLGDLVRKRLGGAVVERLVTPFVRERFGVDPDELDVAIGAPGLNEALTRAGSLTGAVLAESEREVARETRIAPAAGWLALRAELLQRLKLYGAEISTAPVSAMRPLEDGWEIKDVDGKTVTAELLVCDLGMRDPGTVVLGVVDLGAVDPDAVDSDAADSDTDDPRAAGRSALMPTRYRAHARVSIADPEDLRDAAEGSSGPDLALPALESVEIAGETWSVRLTHDEAEGWEAWFAGPAQEVEWANLTSNAPDCSAPGLPASAHTVNDQLSTASVHDALTRLGLTPRDADHDEMNCALRVAPFTHAAQRDAAAEALRAWRDEHPSIFPVGLALHGDDLAAAVADARSEAVRWRRKLTGIAD